MAQEYISYMQTENLFKIWPMLKTINESLTLEIKALETNDKEVDDYIYTQVVGNKVLNDTPPSGKISDTTGNTVASYKQVIKNDYTSTLECIKKEKFCVDLIDDKLNISYRRLSPMQQLLLKLFYWDRKTWAEVLTELRKEKHFISKDQAQHQRRIGIEQIQITSKVNIDMYLKAMKLVEVD